MTCSARPTAAPRTALVLAAAIAMLALTTSVAGAAKQKPQATKAADKSADTKPAPTMSSASAGLDAAASGMAGAIPGLPHYNAPAQYSVDLVINAGEMKDMVMHRSVDNGRMRTDIDIDGQSMSMIELGDDKGTTYMLMPKEKSGFKQSRQGMQAITAKVGVDVKAPEAGAEAPSATAAKVEDLGEEKLGGRTVKKIRMSMDEGSAVGWFDKETGAPLKMESKVQGEASTIEWKNMKPGPQPEALFTIPKGYEITDMDEMMSKMQTMGGAGGLNAGALSGLVAGGMPGMSGGLTGAMKGMAGNYGQSFGSQMGGTLGSTLGASLGGPLGAMAGQYIGGKIGGFLGKKAVDAVIPGK